MNETDYKWLISLKKGDFVCDCRYRHVQIKDIKEIHFNVSPVWFSKLFIHKWLPERLYWFFRDVGEWLGKPKLYDKTLELADGSTCSARNCCDPVDHDEGHPLFTVSD